MRWRHSVAGGAASMVISAIPRPSTVAYQPPSPSTFDTSTRCVVRRVSHGHLTAKQIGRWRQLRGRELLRCERPTRHDVPLRIHYHYRHSAIDRGQHIVAPRDSRPAVIQDTSSMRSRRSWRIESGVALFHLRFAAPFGPERRGEVRGPRVPPGGMALPEVCRSARRWRPKPASPWCHRAVHGSSFPAVVWRALRVRTPIPCRCQPWHRRIESKHRPPLPQQRRGRGWRRYRANVDSDPDRIRWSSAGS